MHLIQQVRDGPVQIGAPDVLEADAPGLVEDEDRRGAQTPHRVVIGPAKGPSYQHRQVIAPEAIDFLSVSTVASVFTLTSANGLSFSLATSLRSWGIHCDAGTA